MVPRMHNRGSSFQAACNYVLHDPGKTSSDRVGWKLTHNLGTLDPEDAWHAMFETWRDRTKLKREAGVDLRGRDNKTPVLHYTLSWALDEKPTDEHMKETALSSLKALKLDQHQALMVAHGDKEHVHLHIVANTVHPETGRTAPLKYAKLALSRWAEAYEREHGIHCQQRIENNEERDRINAERKKEKERNFVAAALGQMSPARPEFKPVNSKSPPRNKWLAKKQVLDRLKRLRAEIDHKHLVERDVTWSRHRDEQAVLTREAKAAATIASDFVRDRFKSQWRDLYRAQRQEAAHVVGIQGNLFERAVFVFKNSERLGNGSPLSWRRKFQLIRSPAKLMKAVEGLHTRERREMGMIEKVEMKERLDRVWQSHEYRFQALKARQLSERQTERDAQRAKAKTSVNYMRANNQIILERDHGHEVRMAKTAPPFETDRQYTERIRADMEAFRQRNMGDRQPWPQSVEQQPLAPAAPTAPSLPDVSDAFGDAAGPGPQPAPSRAEQIKLDMAEWRKRNPGRDFGREM